MREQFVNIDQLAEHFSVSVSTIRHWLRDGHIPEDAVMQVGKTFRYKLSDVENALYPKKKDESLSTVFDVRSVYADADTDY